MDSVKKSLPKVLNISEVFLWTDSQITLEWIKAENKEFQTFAENRVQEIRKLTDSRDWYYCNKKSNREDLLTRIQNISDFKTCDLWLASLNFLRGKRFNDRVVFSNSEQDFHDLKCAVCLQQNCKHVFDELKRTICLAIWKSRHRHWHRH